ncbi:hypothetical protein PsorP6_000623 [Peronosclerospora sorghi]|uniref:Uncharacterized protein n=1 Tax=Peronosclerospora sorghi TaxID=230839 RepID=A0ACC0WWT5_9STRA|nr:hypothetical protein PsorP6_000623 [Peronosclerospora sorghi]
MLHEIGFWCSHDGDDPLTVNRPNPCVLVDTSWFNDCDTILLKTIEWYLTCAFVESHELGYSYCRFSTCSVALEQPQLMGACTLTDGVYCWPEGYWHYISYHHVKPPQEFLDHLVARYDVMVAMTQKAREEKKLLRWDEHEDKPTYMPTAMQEWITHDSLNDNALTLYVTTTPHLLELEPTHVEGSATLTISSLSPHSRVTSTDLHVKYIRPNIKYQTQNSNNETHRVPLWAVVASVTLRVPHRLVVHLVLFKSPSIPFAKFRLVLSDISESTKLLDIFRSVFRGTTPFHVSRTSIFFAMHLSFNAKYARSGPKSMFAASRFSFCSFSNLAISDSISLSAVRKDSAVDSFISVSSVGLDIRTKKNQLSDDHNCFRIKRPTYNK